MGHTETQSRLSSVFYAAVGALAAGLVLSFGADRLSQAAEVITEKSGLRLIVEPPAGSPEEAVFDSLKLMRSGDVDIWMDKWCPPGECDTPAQKAALRAGALRGPLAGAKHCLRADAHGKDTMAIARVVGNPARDTTLVLDVLCEPARTPTPAALVRVRGGGWKVRNIPFGKPGA